MANWIIINNGYLFVQRDNYLMRYYFIVNPISGSGRGATAFMEARELMDKADMDYGFAYTEYKGHAIELARAAIEAGERSIIAVGGDGTTQEVASVVMGTDAVMGLFPFGTGNDFAAAAGLPRDAAGALEALIKYDVRPIDTAMANDRFFINVAGFGFDVDVVVNTEKYTKKYNGMLPYMLGVLKAALHLRPISVEMEYDGKTVNERALLFSVCNGTQFAGGMKLAPLASPFDGTLDICILRAISLPQFLWLLPRYIAGKHLDSPHISYFKTDSISVRSDIQSTLNLDGELYGSTPVDFTIRKQALNFIVGEVDRCGGAS